MICFTRILCVGYVVYDLCSISGLSSPPLICHLRDNYHLLNCGKKGILHYNDGDEHILDEIISFSTSVVAIGKHHNNIFITSDTINVSSKYAILS